MGLSRVNYDDNTSNILSFSAPKGLNGIVTRTRSRPGQLPCGYRFSAPKGLNGIVTIALAGLMRKAFEFQCPEGLEWDCHWYSRQFRAR